MGSRSQSMASIQAALMAQTLSSAPTAPFTDSLDNATQIPDSLTPDEKRALDAKRQARLDAERAQKDAQSDVEHEAALLQQQEEEQKTQAERLLQSIQQTARNILTGAGVTLGRLPTPGDIMLPLLILLFFFFFLIPVNGHTRLMWLWLVLSGNASIGSGGSGGSTGNASSGGSTVANIPIAATVDNINSVASGITGGVTAGIISSQLPGIDTSSIAQVASGIMTGVEDVIG